MIVLSINLLILSIGILIVGMIRPQWILFWMEKKDRLIVILLSSILFMVSVVMFTQATLQNKEFTEEEIAQKKSELEESVPVVDEGEEGTAENKTNKADSDNKDKVDKAEKVVQKVEEVVGIVPSAVQTESVKDVLKDAVTP